MKTVFLRVLEDDDKGAALLEAVRAETGTSARSRFEVDTESFVSVPRSPFAYWVSDRLRALFKELPSFGKEGRTAKQGLATADDFRFVRAWWEAVAEKTGACWFPFAKGGAFSPFYADVHLLVNWEREGSQIKNNLNDRGGVRSNVWMLRETASTCFFRPGLTWPLRTQRGFSLRVLSAGCVFGHKGPAAFTANDHEGELGALLAFGNSSSFSALVEMQMAFGSYEVGVIQRTPVPELAEGNRDILAHLAHRAWSLRRSLDTRTETSHAFTLPALLQVEGPDLATRVEAWSEQVREVEDELKHILSEIDDRCFAHYDIGEADRRAISDGFGAGASDVSASEDADDAEDASVTEPDEGDATVNTAALAAELVSWAAGVAFGRFDVRLATGVREIPPEPKPFDSLPACSPGMLTRNEGLPATDMPDAYPLDWPSDGIMVDDAGHSEDLATRVRDVFEVVFGANADAFWQECMQLLGGDHRRWLARSFFETHVKSHSKSRRKAPIYWQLATPTGSYSVWLYTHRANPDTLFRVLNDVVTPKLRHEERKLTSLTQEAGMSASASQRTDIQSQRGFVEELRALRDEVARVAPLWRPELDDGILVTCAPLWRLVPQHRIWQREAKACWMKLIKGEYDWAHLAMHLWPERVVPKCAHDCSLAIAHGLEEEFWAEDADGKWASRHVDGATVERLIQERSSAAVKAALADLLAAG